MKKKIRLPIDKEDARVLKAKTSGMVECTVCGKGFKSAYKRTRRVCPQCFKRKTGYSYID